MQVDLVKLTTTVVATSSLLHTILPPWEAFNDFPRLQKYYKLFIYFVGYAALNGRSTVWSTLSTADGSKTSKAANGVKTNGGGH
jgi:hypothetical protein